MSDQLNMRLILKNAATEEVRHGTIDDYPGDSSIIFVEALVTESGDICSIQEVEDEFDQRPIEVGWHFVDCDDQVWEIIRMDEPLDTSKLDKMLQEAQGEDLD